MRAQRVGGEVFLEPVGVHLARVHHATGVVDQDVQRRVALGERFAELDDLFWLGKIQAMNVDVLKDQKDMKKRKIQSSQYT